MGRIPNPVPPFFFSRKTGLAAEAVLPPGPDHAFDSAIERPLWPRRFIAGVHRMRGNGKWLRAC